MEQRVQYATTSDGLAIAYAVTGSGPVVISVPSPPDNHLQLEWTDLERRADIESMSRRRTIVRFDPRGAGMSDRDIESFTLEDRLRDLEAVVTRGGWEPFALASGSHGVQLAVAYAAKHREQVTHLSP